MSGQLQATNAVLAASVAGLPGQMLGASNVFTASNRFSGALVATNGYNQFAGSFAGDGSGLTQVSAAGLVGALNALQLPPNVVYAEQLVGTNVNLLSTLGVLSLNDTAVPLMAKNVLNTNSLDAYDVMLGVTRMTNLFEARSGVQPNVLSIDAVGRLSIGRNGAPAQAMAHFGSAMLQTSTTNSSFLKFDSMNPDRQRSGGWGLSHALGDNPTDPRKNKLWSWGFNYGAQNGRHSPNEPNLYMNMETWWEPWPGASDDDHQMELYWQYGNHNGTFGMRPWGLLLRGSNFIQNDLYVDTFTIGSGDGLRDSIFRVQTRRAPNQGGTALMQGVLQIVPGTPMGGQLYMNNSAIFMADGAEGSARVLQLGPSGGEFLLSGQSDQSSPSAGIFESGFTYHHLQARYSTNVAMTVFGNPSQATNLMEFRRQRGEVGVPLAAVSGAGVINAAGYQVSGVSGVTTNVAFLAPGGVTNTLVFSRGILVEVRAGPPPAP
ncbi:MAG: hypothetical protein EBY09_00260 [Verrucomicrobia bacterium]|nr:hypothetical protein [Verrucomicrobiota bacterium]NDD39409.1 hypothetical protein [Verrucomicrobiota bacterium]